MPSKKELFLKLSKFDINKPNEYKIVNTNQFIGEYKELVLGNGGSWCRRSSWKKYKCATYKTNRKVNFLWIPTDEERKEIENIFSKYDIDIKQNSTKIQYIGIFGILSTKENKNRPIRKDIKDYWAKIPCVVCGKNSELQCDHKNDLYNDERVLNIKTQKISDFQSLCIGCNQQKRQVCVQTKKTGKRYSARNIPMLCIFEIDFIEGDETFNVKDPNAMKGTFWYDPIEFIKFIKNK